MKKVLAIGVLVIAVALWFWNHRRTHLEPSSFKNFNVLLVTLDTTRADHLPMYGYNKVKTPNLEALAKRSFVFEDAISHVPLTLPSHTSILSGMLPVHHGVRDNSGFFVDDQTVLLSEVLNANGYRTSAFVSAFVLHSTWKLNRGFDLYDDYFPVDSSVQFGVQETQRRAEDTAARAAQWLNEQSSSPFFCWVHFYDPHDPYTPPEAYAKEYASNPYDGEIAYMDAAIGKLLDPILRTRLQENTIIIVTADHGEGLGEHQEDTHAMFLYDTTQRVPLSIYVPGVKGERVSSVVQHVDLFPTVLDLLGIHTPSKIDGSSLLPMLNGGIPAGRTVYVETMYPSLHYGWSPLAGIVTEQFKYVDAPKPELYERRRDPGETRNLFAEKTQTVAELKQSLVKIRGQSKGSNPQPVDSETEEKMRSLGYLASSPSKRNAQNHNIDPKDKIHLIRNLEAASREIQNARFDRALALLTETTNNDASIPDAHFLSGVCRLSLGQLDKAIQDFDRSLVLRPKHTMSLYNLARAYEQKGDHGSALHYYGAVLELEPEHYYANISAGRMYRTMNQPELARPYFVRTIRQMEAGLTHAKGDDEKAVLHGRLGEAYFGAGDLAEAELHFQKAVQFSPQQRNFHYNLGSIYEAQGKVEAALNEYQLEIQRNPGNYKAWNNLGMLYDRVGNFGKAEQCFVKIIELLPDQPRGYLMLASLYEKTGRAAEANRLREKAK